LPLFARRALIVGKCALKFLLNLANPRKPRRNSVWDYRDFDWLNFGGGQISSR
jgi:hypothetical protein